MVMANICSLNRNGGQKLIGRLSAFRLSTDEILLKIINGAQGSPRIIEE